MSPEAKAALQGAAAGICFLIFCVGLFRVAEGGLKLIGMAMGCTP